MNRVYTRESYLALVERLYERIPDLALSTDVIVGFPGESEADFEDTLDVVRRSRFDQAFTFIYSPREGTPAATMSSPVPRDVIQARFDRLVELVHSSALDKPARPSEPSNRSSSRVRANATRNSSLDALPATRWFTWRFRRVVLQTSSPDASSTSTSTKRRPGFSQAAWVPTTR